ncbi:MAG: GNAT family N-acetyltransferase [Oscillospiraceae bacterium]|nr:GNAT family N-acetyltransferase [Oscillospiraceae bacterium]
MPGLFAPGTGNRGAIYLLTDKEPCGIVSVAGDCIENLYVLPRLQNRGYGTRLLRFAAGLCQRPDLTALSSNDRAIALYRRLGFRETGEKKRLRADLWELILEKNND